MKLRKTLTALITIAAMVVPVFVYAGGTTKINTYTADVEGGTLKAGLGYITEDAELTRGILGYEGDPVDLKIPYKINLKPLDAIGAMSEEKSMECPIIYEGAFKNCSSLKSIELSGNAVEKGAFENCDNLETVIFGNSEYPKNEDETTVQYVTNNASALSEGAFTNCTSLKKIVVKTYLNCDIDVFKNCPVETIVMPEKLDDYVIPDDTNNARLTDTYQFPRFSGLKELKNVNVPYGIYFMPFSFTDCTSLENIELPETVGDLYGTFQNCTNLKEVRILGKNTKIRKDAFENCPNVTIVCYPDSLSAENCKTYGINAVDFDGNAISGNAEAPKQEAKTSEPKTDEISVILNGNKLSFTQSPVIENGTTLVPMRAIFEAMGASVEWDGTTQTVTSVKGDTTISLTLNKETAIVNGKGISLAVPAKLINGNTMVPLRFVSESLGAEVNWDGTSRTITINN